MNTPDTRFVQRARELYRAAAQHVDPLTGTRLRAARIRALATPRAGERRPGTRWLVPGGAFAAAAFATVLLWQPLTHLRPPPAAGAVNSTASASDMDSDLPPDADQTDPTLYQNLDFYGWLAANDRPTHNR
ncbi:MAG TPA: hypothetical protein VLZ55_07305 [Rhodanobacter sp.]|nr:hypothetical protein [Rhodanobacter sp.]